MGASAATMAQSWTVALAQQDSSNDKLLSRVGQTLQIFSETFEQRSVSLVNSVSETFAASQANQAASNQQQLATWKQSLESIAATLQREWQVAGAQTLAQQQQICTTLDQTAQQITEQSQANTHETLGEITRLLDAASEAPRAAAEVIGQLRQELSSSMVRDNAMLEERSRILETLSALLDTINHASAEQRSTIDSLVASSEALMSRVGSQFAEKVDAESARLSDSAAQVTGSAVEVSALSESFNFAVQLFAQTNEKLITNLQRIETAMDKSLARSDDQLGYYVAQAREIIDLSIMSQKEVFDDLRTLRSQQASLAEEVA
jgi:nitroreductase